MMRSVCRTGAGVTVTVVSVMACLSGLSVGRQKVYRNRLFENIKDIENDCAKFFAVIIFFLKNKAM